MIQVGWTSEFYISISHLLLYKSVTTILFERSLYETYLDTFSFLGLIVWSVSVCEWPWVAYCVFMNSLSFLARQ